MIATERLRRLAPAAVAAIGLLMFLVAVVAMTSRRGNAEEPGTTTPEAGPTTSETPTIEPSPTPFPTIPPPPEPATTEGPALPVGPVVADAVEVDTDDGKCLNVRWTPGTLFATEPLFCAPEGTVLWLYGRAREVDGQQWRWALGGGWVAIIYTRPVPETPRPFDVGTMSVLQEGWPESVVASFDSSGAEVGRLLTTLSGGGLGAATPAFSPDGRYLAGADANTGTGLIVLDVMTGTELLVPDAYHHSWSPDGRLLVRHDQVCDATTCTMKAALLDPATGTLDPIVEHGLSFWVAGFAPDGTLYVMDEQRQLLRLRDGAAEALLTFPEETYYGQIAVSPDGSRLALTSYLAPILILDLATLESFSLDRAPQLEDVGGRCGGGSVATTAWFDSDHLVYHEASSSSGSNGLTIVSVESGESSLIPSTYINSLAVHSGAILTYSSYESVEFDAGQGKSFVVTWALDTATGERWPVAFGRGTIELALSAP